MRRNLVDLVDQYLVISALRSPLRLADVVAE